MTTPSDVVFIKFHHRARDFGAVEPNPLIFWISFGFFRDILFFVFYLSNNTSAIFTLLGMSITSKSLTTTFTLVLTFVLLLGSMSLLQFLSQPEYIPENQITARDDLEADGMPPFVAAYVTETETTEDGAAYNLVPNPMYITGMRRDIMNTVIDVLPGGQMLTLQSSYTHNEKLYPLYSLGVIAVTTAAGVLFFRRKDLK